MSEMKYYIGPKGEIQVAACLRLLVLQAEVNLLMLEGAESFKLEADRKPVPYRGRTGLDSAASLPSAYTEELGTSVVRVLVDYL